jgi:hypothetical protein
MQLIKNYMIKNTKYYRSLTRKFSTNTLLATNPDLPRLHLQNLVYLQWTRSEAKIFPQFYQLSRFSEGNPLL